MHSVQSHRNFNLSIPKSKQNFARHFPNHTQKFKMAEWNPDVALARVVDKLDEVDIPVEWIDHPNPTQENELVIRLIRNMTPYRHDRELFIRQRLGNSQYLRNVYSRNSQLIRAVSKKLLLRQNQLETKKAEKLNRKRKFGEHALSEISSLLDQPDESFSDVKVVSNDGKEFRAHKCILLARSPVFKPMLTNGMEESYSGVIRMEDISSNAVQALLHFIYTCKILPFVVDCDKEGAVTGKLTLSEFIHAAAKYQIADLIEFFDENIASFCTKSNAIFLLQLANRFSLRKGQSEIKRFVRAVPSLLDEILDNQ